MATFSPTSPDETSPTTTLTSPTNPQEQSSTNPIFLATPTINTSDLSLPIAGTASSPSTQRDPLLRTRSQNLLPTSSPLSKTSPSPSLQNLQQNLQSPSTQNLRRPRPQDRHQSEVDRTDALWAEMQTTLLEVELSASNSSHSFFGPDHASALESLRTAQIALAQAWARSEAQEEVVSTLMTKGTEENVSPGGSVRGGSVRGDEGNMGGIVGGERETEADILLARKRREANDKYFYRVSKGVIDVVSKLEEVASAMGKVERESRDVWSESEGSLDEQE